MFLWHTTVAVQSRWVSKNSGKKQHCAFPCSGRPSGGRECACLGTHGASRAGRQAGTEEGLLGPLSTYIMSVRDCKGPLWGCLWFVAEWAWLMVFIFENISRPWLYFLSTYNSMVWILIRPSAQACFMSEMLLVAWSLMLLTKTSLVD